MGGGVVQFDEESTRPPAIPSCVYVPLEKGDLNNPDHGSFQLSIRAICWEEDDTGERSEVRVTVLMVRCRMGQMRDARLRGGDVHYPWADA